MRSVIALILILGLLITALELSAASRNRNRARRPGSVADVVTGRPEAPSVPHAPEVDETAPATSPAMTY